MKSREILNLVRHMSKSRKSSAPPPAQPSGPVFSDKNGNVVIQILAKPGAKSNGITGIEEEGVGVQINARPVDGEANSELVKYVMSVLGLKKNEISLDKEEMHPKTILAEILHEFYKVICAKFNGLDEKTYTLLGLFLIQ